MSCDHTPSIKMSAPRLQVTWHRHFIPPFPSHPLQHFRFTSFRMMLGIRSRYCMCIGNGFCGYPPCCCMASNEPTPFEPTPLSTGTVTQTLDCIVLRQTFSTEYFVLHTLPPILLCTYQRTHNPGLALFHSIGQSVSLAVFERRMHCLCPTFPGLVRLHDGSWTTV